MDFKIKYHIAANGIKIAEILSGSDLICGPDDILDILSEAGYNNCGKLIIHERNLHPDFFDLKTRIAGEILQKFSNYRMSLTIIGDFKKFKSKSLEDFIRESNKRGVISFVDSFKKAMKSPDY